MANWMRKNVKPPGSRSGVAAVPIPFLVKGVDPVGPRMPVVVQQARRLIVVPAPGEVGAGEVPDAVKGSS